MDDRRRAVPPRQRSRDQRQHVRRRHHRGGARRGQPRAIWDRWNAASPEQQAAWFLEHDERLVSTLEALTPEQRESLTVDLGFLPEPVSLDTAIGMRLNEVAAHAWDVRVGLDPAAALHADSADLLAEHFAGGLGFLLGFSAKADQLPQQAIVKLDGYEIAIDEGVRVVPGTSEGETATFTGPLEAGIRLLSGRLTPGVHACRRDGHRQRDAGGPAEGVPGVLSPVGVTRFRRPGRAGRSACCSGTA